MANAKMAPVARAANTGGPSSEYESKTTTVRQIENGYVVCESECKDGSYRSREYFTETKPSPTATGPGQSSLSDAVKAVRR